MRIGIGIFLLFLPKEMGYRGIAILLLVIEKDTYFATFLKTVNGLNTHSSSRDWDRKDQKTVGLTSNRYRLLQEWAIQKA